LGLLPFFLVPSAILFRLSPLQYRPWVIVAGGSSFFLYFSYTELGGFLRRVLEFFYGNPSPAGFTGQNRGSAGWE
jgi:hypothetical protein